MAQQRELEQSVGNRPIGAPQIALVLKLEQTLETPAIDGALPRIKQRGPMLA